LNGRLARRILDAGRRESSDIAILALALTKNARIGKVKTRRSVDDCGSKMGDTHPVPGTTAAAAVAAALHPSYSAAAQGTVEVDARTG
jgi:hypothetical protein